MKRYVTVVLILLLFLPVAVIFLFDARYTSLQNSVCSDSKAQEAFSPACSYGERNERERGVTTAFYRHIASYFGRHDGTSPSWFDLATGNANDWFDINGDGTALLMHDVHQKIGVFNREFAASLLASTVVAAVAATLLTQHAISAYKGRGGRHAGNPL